ncbi:MAG: sulfatase-like hydrolase/transferase [Verrucomicrobiota bacterium]
MRIFLTLVGATWVVWFGTALSASAAAAARPNVLIIFADQQNADVMGCAGHPIVKTPNLDQLAASGVRFTRAYCQDAICVPSRTSLMTGLYPRTTGCLDNEDSPVIQTNLYPMQQIFQSAGYLTGCFGKRHLPTPTLASGWDHSATVISPKQDPSDENYDDWIATREPGQAEAFKRDNPGSLESDMGCHISDVKPENRIEAYTAMKAREFLVESKKQGKPFFCWTSFHGPHQPYTPPAKWADLYPIESMPLPASVNEPIEDLPPGLQHLRRNTKPPWNLAKAAKDPDLYRKYIAYYFAQVTEVDHCIGEVLAELDLLGLRDNTVVIYASDHGDFVARHGMIEKAAVSHNVYEETLHVPIIVSWPKHFQQGVTCNSLAELVDIYPTLVDLLGLQRPVDAPKLAGRSLVPTLTAGKPTGRVYAVSENWSQTTVITDRYKLGIWIDPTARFPQRDFRKETQDMLFDRETDPQELVNLEGKADYADVEKKLRAYLSEWTSHTPDHGKKALSVLPVKSKRKN